MSKDRVAAFMDAILAIIMTILVLELKKPEAPTIEAVWALRNDFFSYFVSFFWLGAMWINIHNQWHGMEKVSNTAIWWGMGMLFFASLIPYVTSFVSEHFTNLFAQLMYSVVVLLVSIANVGLGNAMIRANNQKEEGLSYSSRNILIADYGIKGIGILLAIFIYPPFAMMGIVLAGVVVTFIPLAFSKAR